MAMYHRVGFTAAQSAELCEHQRTEPCTGTSEKGAGFRELQDSQLHSLGSVLVQNVPYWRRKCAFYAQFSAVYRNIRLVGGARGIRTPDTVL